MFATKSGSAGRRLLRTIGALSALIALAAGYSAVRALMEDTGAESVVLFVLFGGGAIIAAHTAHRCFSHRRTLEEFFYSDGHQDRSSADD